MAFYVYILTNRRNGTLYVGMTDDLRSRISQHQAKLTPGFASRYGCNQLVWHETHETRASAFLRERQIKEWRRVWKLNLIEALNPDWRDFSQDLTA